MAQTSSEMVVLRIQDILTCQAGPGISSSDIVSDLSAKDIREVGSRLNGIQNEAIRSDASQSANTYVALRDEQKENFLIEQFGLDDGITMKKVASVLITLGDIVAKVTKHLQGELIKNLSKEGGSAFIKMDEFMESSGGWANFEYYV